MTIGDVFAIIASVIAICLSEWALFMGMALIFQSRSREASRVVQVRPWRSLGIGFGLMATIGAVSIAMLYTPFPVVKLFGWVGIMTLLAVASLGASGLAQMIAGRIQRIESGVSGFGSLARGAGILVVAGLVPVFGWFVFGPLVLLVSIGVGVQALFARLPEDSTVTAPPLNLGAM